MSFRGVKRNTRYSVLVPGQEPYVAKNVGDAVSHALSYGRRLYSETTGDIKVIGVKIKNKPGVTEIVIKRNSHVAAR